MARPTWLAILIVLLNSAATSSGANPATGASEKSSLDKIYGDESHCLTGPEIRNERDSAISCYCRDAITDARYVYHTYLLTGKDPNLNGTLLALQTYASERCGEGYNVWTAITTKQWSWKGPEVTRTYPPDAEIERITPDAKGFRRVPYRVRLTYRNASGAVAKVENYGTWYLDGAFNSRIPKR